MNEITTLIGQRIKNHRKNLKLNQEKLAELACCHPTYIGQIERGEKNATIESIEKITKALNISMSTLFEKIEDIDNSKNSYSLKCYEIVNSKSLEKQKILYEILLSIENYKE